MSNNALPPRVAAGTTGELTRREHPEAAHAYRTPFSRDRARVLHARAFRRLAGKTQVFTRLPGELSGDHFRSRLTHTLEVAQIARTVASVLGLNADLAEGLALVHDIGHPPFGHAGEKALDRALQASGLGFDHNLHALRIVTWFEERSPGYRGLNLTLGMREGIIKHSRDYSRDEHPDLAEYFLDRRPPLEAQLIDLADEIAYLTADIEDGLESGILKLEQVRAGVPLFRAFHDAVTAQFPQAASRPAANEALKRMLNALVTDLIDEVRRQVAEHSIESLNDVRMHPQRLAVFSPAMEQERGTAKTFLYARLYNSPDLEEVHGHAEEVVRTLFERFMADPKLLPDDHRAQVPSQGLARTVTDYVAGMTDGFIERMWLAQQAAR